jgi:hypothetical protein
MLGDCGACCAIAAELKLIATNAVEAARHNPVIPLISLFSR